MVARGPARSYPSRAKNGLSPGSGCEGVRVLLMGTGVQPIPPRGYGGVERTIAEYAQALETAGHTARIVNEAGRGRSIDEYRFALGLRPRALAEDADVVHVSTPVVANRFALARVPFVYTTHSRHWFERAGLRQRFGFFLERRAVARAAATVALTDRLEREVHRWVPAAGARTSVIPIGVDTERFVPDWGRRTGTVALGVGVIAPFKRWELAVAAAAGTGFSLRLIGPVADAAYAERLRRAGPVELLGEVDDPRLLRAYAESDVLLHPSRVELLAGVVLQALAAGLPVLGAEPVADLIPDGAGGGAPSGSDADGIVRFLRDGLGRFADAPRRRAAGDAARAGALARYAWPAVVAAHVALYRRLARPR